MYHTTLGSRIIAPPPPLPRLLIFRFFFHPGHLYSNPLLLIINFQSFLLTFLSINSLKRRIKKTESDVVEEIERGEADSQESDEERNLFETLCNQKPSFLSFLVLNCVGNMCPFVEKKEKNLVFSLTYKY